jgi:hypothetical protein
MTSLRCRLAHDEGGWALVTAIILMSVMLATGLAFASVVDTQQGASREQRVRETAFNLAESALSAQLFSLSTPAGWPGVGYATAPYPTCTQASVLVARCPNDQQLRSAFSSVDLGPEATWETAVRDNEDGEFYDDALAGDNAGYDRNDDQRLWVRARATAKGKTRTLVAMVRIYEQSEDAPRAAIIAGRLNFPNAGNKSFIEGGGAVQVRCLPDTEPLCLGNKNNRPGDLEAQMPGSTPVYGVPKVPLITPAARERLRQTAIANGTYYESCGSGQPPSAHGDVVYVKNGPCTWRGNGVYNSPQKPGMLIMENGLLAMKEDYYGVIYHANLADSAEAVVDTSGNGHIVGGILVDGLGLAVVGDAKENVRYDPNGFGAVKSYGTAGVIQNTWREIKSQ